MTLDDPSSVADFARLGASRAFRNAGERFAASYRVVTALLVAPRVGVGDDQDLGEFCPKPE
jgi:hypothetical protein